MKWLTLTLGGQRWGVYLVNPGHKRLQDDDAHVFGITYPTECRIYLARGQPDDAFEDTLLHELLHAALHVCGGANEMAAKEERVVAALTPVLHRALKDLGFRFPRDKR